MEFAGTVITPPPTGKFRKGDRVFGAKQGAYATRVTVKEDVLHRVPDGWSFEDAAGLYVTGDPPPLPAPPFPLSSGN